MMCPKRLLGPLVAALVLGHAATAAAQAETKTCRFRPTSQPLALVRGASDQRLETKKSVMEARRALESVAVARAAEVAKEFSTNCESGLYTLRDRDNSTLQIPVAIEAKGSDKVFVFKAVPPDLPLGPHIWFVESVQDDPATKTMAGIIDLPVVGFPVPDPLTVAYKDAELDRLQSGVAARGPHGRPAIGVVNLLWQTDQAKNADGEKEKNKKREVLNTSGFSALQGLPVAPKDGLSWVITQSTWGDRVWFEDGDCDGAQPCSLKSLAKISFAVRERIPNPLIVWLSLKTGDNALFTIPVELASEARVESLPFSINHRIRILCGDEDAPSVVVRSSGTKAVDDQDLFQGRCRARICYCSPCAENPDDALFCKREMGASTGKPRCAAAGNPTSERDRARAILFGPQTLEVRVHRDGTGEDAVQRWTLNPPSKLQGAAMDKPGHDDLSLSVPDQGVNANGDGLYRVEIRVDATAPEAVYREGASLQGRNINIAAGLADRQFIAYLRRTGPFGFPTRKSRDGRPRIGNVRMFATIPVQALGIRIPANIRNLRNSGDSTLYELATLRTGIAAVVEPWNYDRYKNLSPVPVRFSVGFNFFSLTNRSFGLDPTFVVSARITFPLVQQDTRVASQLGSSVTLGPALEVDLRTGRPYFFINLGLDLLTLFSTQ